MKNDLLIKMNFGIRLLTYSAYHEKIRSEKWAKNAINFSYSRNYSLLIIGNEVIIIITLDF